MVKLPTPPPNRTGDAIHSRYRRDAEDWRRAHLGASIIGDECGRALWYSFRWAADPDFEGRMLRLFERGQREEDWIVEDMRLAGMRVENADEATGKQYRFRALGGHFAGSCDGAVLGVPDAPKTWHLLEVKTSNDKRFAELLRDGVQKSNPKHYAQMQTYMHAFKLKRALYVCVNKNDDRIYTERVKYDKAEALAILEKAARVINAREPLSKIREDPSWWKCKMCDHQAHCQLGETAPLQRNCRTCVSSTPMPDGTWHCSHHGRTLDIDQQRKGCPAHLFIPALMWAHGKVDDASETDRWVLYEDGWADRGQ